MLFHGTFHGTILTRAGQGAGCGQAGPGCRHVALALWRAEMLPLTDALPASVGTNQSTRVSAARAGRVQRAREARPHIRRRAGAGAAGGGGPGCRYISFIH